MKKSVMLEYELAWLSIVLLLIMDAMRPYIRLLLWAWHMFSACRPSPVLWGGKWMGVTSYGWLALGTYDIENNVGQAVLAVGGQTCLFFFCLWSECQPNSHRLFATLCSLPCVVLKIFSMVLDSPGRGRVQRRKNFSRGHEGGLQELMKFVECGPLDLSSLRRFRFLAS